MSIDPRYRTADLSAYRSEGRRAPARVLIVAGRFDRGGIMREAIRIARSIGMKGWTWAKRMRAGLLQAWKLARAELAVPVRVERAPVLRPAREPGRVRCTAFVRGSRIFSHGW